MGSYFEYRKFDYLFEERPFVDLGSLSKFLSFSSTRKDKSKIYIKEYSSMISNK